MQSSKDSALLELIKLRAGNGHGTDPSALLALGNSIDHGQVALINDRFGRLAGYVAWANLSKESAFRALRLGRRPLGCEDWNEGKFLVVVDFYLTKRVPLRPAAILALLPARKYVIFVRKNFLYILKPRTGIRPVYKQRMTSGMNVVLSQFEAGRWSARGTL